MLFSGVTPEQVAAITSRVSEEKYDGNVVPEWIKRGRSQPDTVLNQDGTRWRGRIVVHNSRGPGAKRSASGRRGANACWHVFRDVLGPILQTGERVKISTQLATYTTANWEHTYPRTARTNVGSLVSPKFPTELCECVEDVPVISVEELLDLVARIRAQRDAMSQLVSPPNYPLAAVFSNVVEAATRASETPDPERMRKRDIQDRIDQVLAKAIKIAEGECASCGKPTGSSAMVWCSQVCQEMFQAKLPGASKIFRPEDEPPFPALY